MPLQAADRTGSVLDAGLPATVYPMTNALVVFHADEVERLAGTGEIWSLRIDACTSAQRITLLKHHARVVRLLHQRGRQVRANVINDPDKGERITIRIVKRQRWAVLQPGLPLEL